MRGGGRGWNRGGKRRAEGGNQEETGDSNMAQAVTRSRRDAGHAFDVAGNGRCAGERAEQCPHSVSDKSSAHARNLAFFDESALFAYAYQCAHIVEKVDEQECEQDFEKAKM